MLKNTRLRWGLISRYGHLGMAVVVVFLLVSGFYIINLPFETREDWSTQQFIFWLRWHKWIGALMIIGTAAYLLWRWWDTRPDFPGHMRPYEIRTSLATHWLMFALVIVISLTGWAEVSAVGGTVTFFDWFTLPTLAPKSRVWATNLDYFHHYGSWVLLFLAGFHTAGAFKHQIHDRDSVLGGMSPWASKSDPN